jgi:hypothetical protein
MTLIKNRMNCEMLSVAKRIVSEMQRFRTKTKPAPGLEPGALRLKVPRSNQLSYTGFLIEKEACIRINFVVLLIHQDLHSVQILHRIDWRLRGH